MKSFWRAAVICIYRDGVRLRLHDRGAHGRTGPNPNTFDYIPH
jgi:hypothetical protein